MLPVQRWLEERGVTVENETRAIDMEFRSLSSRYQVKALELRRKSDESEVSVDDNDLVIFTNGSMTDASTLSSMITPAILEHKDLGGAWALWRKLAMPYITSQFLPRAKGDRPEVVPEGSVNLAFVSQFSDAADDVVFTVEYSVRTAKMAVKSLLGLDVPIPEVYKGQRDPLILLSALRESMT
jgi:myosin-crossreactive antigen